jgi:hypothetical protein
MFNYLYLYLNTLLKTYDIIQYDAAVRYVERNTMRVRIDTSRALLAVIATSIAVLIFTVVSIYIHR